MTEMPQDQAVRDEILSPENFDRNVFLSAGAGAGKTSTMVDRIIAQLTCESPLEPANIAAITYTNAAAEEIRGRLISRLSARRAMEPEDSPAWRRVSHVLDHIGELYIGTIHSFCHLLLSKYAYQARLQPDARILEDTEQEEQEQQFFARWYIEHISSRPGDEPWLQELQPDSQALLQAYFSQICQQFSMTDIIQPAARTKAAIDRDAQDLIEGKEGFKALYAQEIRQSVYSLTGRTDGYLDGRDFDQLTAYGTWLADPQLFQVYLKSNGTPTLTTACQKIYRLPASANRYLVFLTAMLGRIDDKDGLYAEAYLQKRSIPRHNPKKDPAGYQDYLTFRSRLTSWQQKAALVIQEYNDYYASHLAELAGRIRQEYHASMNFLTNDELLQKAYDLICRPGDQQAWAEMMQDIRQTFRCIYVDEFQDTSLIQAEILKKIAERPEAEQKPGNCLRDGALFVVGDPKQSIYRFAGADPVVFFQVRQLFEDNSANCLVRELTTNFRSSGSVITWVNENFSARMDAYTCMDESGRQKLRDQAENQPGPQLPRFWQTAEGRTIPLPEDIKIVCGVYAMAEDDLKFTERSRNDPGETAAVIQALMQKGKYGIFDHCVTEEAVREHQNHGQPAGVYYRPLAYRDFLILTRNTTHLSRYEKALREKEIPVAVSGRIRVSENPSAVHYILLYHALAAARLNPDSGTLTVLDQSAWQGGLEVLKKHAMDDSQAETVLQQLARQTSALSGYGLALVLWDHAEFYMQVPDQQTESPRTVCSEADIRGAQMSLAQLIEKITQEMPDDRQQIAAALMQYRSGEEAIERTLLPQEDFNAVRLMNEHKAKGLEGKIVILADRSESRDHDGPVRVQEKDRYRYYGQAAGSTYAIKAWHDLEETKGERNLADAQASAEEDEKEDGRLEYVTVTRAEEAFIFMKPIRPDGKVQFRWVTPSAAPAEKPGQLQRLEDLIPDLDRPAEPEEKTEEQPAEFRPPAFPAALPQEPAVLDLVPSFFEDVQSSPADGLVQNQPAGTVFGTLMHRCYELAAQRWDQLNHTVSEPEPVARIVRQALLETLADQPADTPAIPLDTYTQSLQELTEKFISDPHIAAYFQAADGVLTEYPFAFLSTLGDLRQDPELTQALAAKGLGQDRYPDEKAVYVHGQSDLLFLLQERIQLLDFKSDLKGQSETLESFRRRKEKAYRGQLAFYRYAMHKIFGTGKPERPVETELYFRYPLPDAPR